MVFEDKTIRLIYLSNCRVEWQSPWRW